MVAGATKRTFACGMTPDRRVLQRPPVKVAGRALDTRGSTCIRARRRFCPAARSGAVDALHGACRKVNPSLTVRGVAQRWGFAHTGRFAQQYLAEFGEHPSQTLRR